MGNKKQTNFGMVKERLTLLKKKTDHITATTQKLRFNGLIKHCASMKVWCLVDIQ